MEQQTTSSKSFGIICTCCLGLGVLYVIVVTLCSVLTVTRADLTQMKADLRQTQADLTKTTSLLRLTQDELAEFKSNVTNEITAIDKEFDDLDAYLAKHDKLNEKLVMLSHRPATNVATNNYFIEKSIIISTGLTEHAKLLAKRLDQHDVKIEKQNDALKAILETIELYH